MPNVSPPGAAGTGGGKVTDGSFSDKAKGTKGKPYSESVAGGPAKSNPKAEPEEKGGSKQK